MSETVQDRIKQRLETLGIKKTTASIRAGLDESYLRKLFDRPEGIPSGEALAKLAKVLEASPGWLLTGTESQSEIEIAPEINPPRQDGRREVPVVGTALGSIIDANGSGFEGFLMDSDPIDWKRMPPGLEGQKEIYALFVIGDSMYPMHPPGELRFAQPHRAPVAGDTVIVQTKHWEADPGQAYIKIFRRRTATELVLEQLNPPATIKIPISYVTHVHRVVPNNELF